jgi:hypothetical protein
MAERQPVHIPLSFTDAVRGLLKVDPKQLKKRVAKKKGVAAKKRTAARKRDQAS